MDSLATLTTQLTAQHPALNGRIERGAAIVEAGCIREIGPTVYEVARPSGSGRYRVTFDLVWRCTCPDFQHNAPHLEFGGSVGPVCKHIIAGFFLWLLGEEAPAPAPAGQPISKAEFEQAAIRKAADKAERRRTALPATDNGRIEDMLGYEVEPTPTAVQRIEAMLQRDRERNERGAAATKAALGSQQRGFEPPFAGANGVHDWRRR